MARALVDLGFSTVAPSPHARAGYAPGRGVVERLGGAARGAWPRRACRSRSSSTRRTRWSRTASSRRWERPRRAGARGPYVLVELPYSRAGAGAARTRLPDDAQGRDAAPRPPRALPGVPAPGPGGRGGGPRGPAAAGPGGAQRALRPVARRTARDFLDEGLYAVAATDLHAPSGRASDGWSVRWPSCGPVAGEPAVERLFRDRPPAGCWRGDAGNARRG